jgi:hypothetical protein
MIQQFCKQQELWQNFFFPIAVGTITVITEVTDGRNAMCGNLISYMCLSTEVSIILSIQ